MAKFWLFIANSIGILTLTDVPSGALMVPLKIKPNAGSSAGVAPQPRLAVLNGR